VFKAHRLCVSLNCFTSRQAGVEAPPAPPPDLPAAITLNPRVEGYTKSTSIKYEPFSEPLHIFVKQLFSN